MMKKLISVMMMLALLTGAVAGFAQDEQAEEGAAVLLTGTILEAAEDYVLLDVAELGEVQAWTNEETVIEGVEALAPGQVAVVLYNGMMTRSLPPQITAQRVSVYAVEGTVTAVEEGRVTILRADGAGDVIVTLPEDAPELTEGTRVTAYTTGIMTMSLPPIMNGIGFEIAGGDALGETE